MSNSETHCVSQCDCDGPDELLGIDHAPDCHSRTECDGDHSCDKHMAEAEADYAYLRGTPRHTVFNDAEAVEERNQELRDAGRGHLVRP